MHLKAAAVDGKVGTRQVVMRLRPGKRQHEVRHLQKTLVPADNGPWSIRGGKGAVERGGSAAGKDKCTGEFERNRRGIRRLPRFGMNAAGHLHRRAVAHGPQGETQAIPAKITQTTERFQRAMRAEVRALKIRIAHEAELRGNVTNVAHL